MTALQMRRAAEQRLRNLPPEKLKVAAEFLIYLETSASDEATAELLRIPGLMEDVRSAHRDRAAGKGVEWRKVRRDV
ncbi:MAG TPA: hypothetical protein DCM87_05015 [Planctomycetes bacterium]|jgi:hypothetical protein|nr:hypothetical protein [Planctomycetota bacterium]